MQFYGWEALMVSQDAARFCDHRHCGSADMMFLVVEWQDSTCPASIHHYCLSLKDMTWKHTACHNNNSDPGHTQLKQQLEKNLKITFTVRPKMATTRKKRRQKVGDDLSTCVSNLLPEVSILLNLVTISLTKVEI